MKTTVYKVSLTIYIKLNPKLIKGHNAKNNCPLPALNLCR